MTKEEKRRRGCFLTGILFCIGALVACITSYNARRLVSRYEAIRRLTPRTSLDSPGGGGREVHIPFRYRDGWIVIAATSGGKPVECVLDTGSSIPWWSTALPVSARHTGVTYPHYAPYHGTASGPAELMMLSELTLGPLKVYDVPGIAYQPTGREWTARFLYLGNSVFAHTVLTIDYRRQELIVRQGGPRTALAGQQAAEKKPEPSRGRRLNFVPRDQRLRFVWSVNPHSLGPGYPTIAGTIAGHPARYGVDTGSAGVPLAIISEGMCSLLRQENQVVVQRSGYLGLEQTRSLTWSLGKVAYRTPVWLVPDLAGATGDADALLGQPVLQNYGVTIDYPRRQILLQWNPLPLPFK